MLRLLSVAVLCAFCAALVCVDVARADESFQAAPVPPLPPPEPPPPPPKPAEPKEIEPKEDEPQDPAVRATPAPGFKHRLNEKGAKRANEDRVLAALEWLKDHQGREGNWSATDFSANSTRDGAVKTYNVEHVNVGESSGDRGWKFTTDLGLTGLALLAFTGAGHDHKWGDFRTVVRAGVLYLRKTQDRDGCFGDKEDDHFVYNHAICTMAIAEIYGLTQDAVLKPILDRAVEFILSAQNPGVGWRYGVRPATNDSSVTSWMVMALHAAKLAGSETDVSKAYDGASAWYTSVTKEVQGYPKTGYDSAGSNNARLRSAQNFDHNPTMDAIYVTSMLAMEKSTTKDKIVKSLSRMIIEKEHSPVWDANKIDYYYWYYGSLAANQVGGTVKKSWDKAMNTALLDNQRGWHKIDKGNKHESKEALDEHGSWDACGAWCAAGGRVYATAMGALILESPYRYETK